MATRRGGDSACCAAPSRSPPSPSSSSCSSPACSATTRCPGPTSSSASTRSPPSPPWSPPREWLERLAWALVTVAVTVVVGRVWCGWICPLGTLLGWFRFGAVRRLEPRVPPRLRVTKYVLLLAIAGMAAFGVLTLLVLDPITILTRTATTSLLPAFDYLVTEAQRLALQWPALDPVVDWVDTTLPRQRAADHAAALRAVADHPGRLPCHRRTQRAGRPLLVSLPLPTRRPCSDSSPRCRSCGRSSATAAHAAARAPSPAASVPSTCRTREGHE